jgi:hypothetical protein
VHVCVTGDGSVLLDLKRDKYLGLNRRQTEWVAALVEAWPRPMWEVGETISLEAKVSPLSPPGCDERTATGEPEDLCLSLLNAGILSYDAQKDSGQREARVFETWMEWISIGDELEVSSQMRISHVLNFLNAYGRARVSLLLRPFADVVEAAGTRKHRWLREFDAGDVEYIAALVGTFRQLRAWVFAAEGRCLLHALSLINFLAHYDFYPDWVIGVATQPWGAHSWVQWGRYLLDSNPEKICRFTPILVV